ncbi:L-serine ammonia-lyase, iron-sulfur-dependent, subunit beta [Acetobacterium fimetarium]|uniref:L-serine deaminase n=1 Tax=Acetobacterium fimetarium TaxID=52691 RepID=A0ABR6WUK5_9FIRM|nr:L-serine ammonia-lyase, iron-sulfur-dependent subunit beta [Acetobacterium fimetarium]MBC3804240.1 L-serine ammonia-lyase, iron-sulfur-dependent, subunit beta [Acetobacterium fimetarium]
MNVFDIIGPIMVGPSSSHTAGAVKIGYLSNKLMGEKIRSARIYLHGSFLTTGKGHGTDKAIIAGLLGMKPDDIRIPESFEVAEKAGLAFAFEGIELRDAHPNSVKLNLTGASGRELEIMASSMGGGNIKIFQIDGLDANFGGDLPTLIVHNQDRPGLVTEVTAMLSQKSINIATMQLYRSRRGGDAVMVLECDQEISKASISGLQSLDGIRKVTYLSLEESA